MKHETIKLFDWLANSVEGEEAEPGLAWLIRGIADAFSRRHDDEANVPLQYRAAYLLGYNTAVDHLVGVREIMEG